jgi:hypothetical protein
VVSITVGRPVTGIAKHTSVLLSGITPPEGVTKVCAWEALITHDIIIATAMPTKDLFIRYGLVLRTGKVIEIQMKLQEEIG